MSNVNNYCFNSSSSSVSMKIRCYHRQNQQNIGAKFHSFAFTCEAEIVRGMTQYKNDYKCFGGAD